MPGTIPINCTQCPGLVEGEILSEDAGDRKIKCTVCGARYLLTVHAGQYRLHKTHDGRQDREAADTPLSRFLINSIYRQFTPPTLRSKIP